VRNAFALLAAPVGAVVIVLGGYWLLGEDFIWAVMAALWLLAAVVLVYNKWALWRR
jgi:hypothetical protein